MNTLTQPLRDEHKDLFPHVDRIRQAAELIGEASIAEIRRGVDEVSQITSNRMQRQKKRRSILSCKNFLAAPMPQKR